MNKFNIRKYVNPIFIPYSDIIYHNSFRDYQFYYKRMKNLCIFGITIKKYKK